MLTLPQDRSRSSQGHDLYKLCRALPPEASCQFQNGRPSGSGEEDFKVFAIYSHGSHLGHVTLTIYLNFHSPIQGYYI